MAAAGKAQAAPKVSLKDPAIKEELAQKVGKIMLVHGKLAGGDPIKKLEGEDLQKDIDFQKDTQHRRYPITDPHYKFRIEDAKLELKDKDSAERYLYQQIYEGKDGKKFLSVETKTDFTIGYRKSPESIAPISRKSLEGKKFAFGQEVTLTYSVYMNKSTQEASIGFENIIFEERPTFYVPEFNSDTVGAVEGQGWDTEVEDFSDEGGTVLPETPAPTDDGTDGGDPAGDAPAGDLWENSWD